MDKRQRDTFLTPLDVRIMLSGKRFRLLHSFVYNWKVPIKLVPAWAKKSSIKISVPVGFETDLASVPVYTILIIAVACLLASHYVECVSWLFWVGLVLISLMVLIQKLGRQNKAAVIHDALYQGIVESMRIIPRWLADRIFLDGLKDLGVGRVKRYLMYWGVRLGGWLSWRGNK